MYNFLVSFWNSPRVEVQTQSNDIEEVLEKAIPKFEKTAPDTSGTSRRSRANQTSKKTNQMPYM